MDEEHENDWHVVVQFSERPERTVARAVLDGGGHELVGHGEAHRNPSDTDVPRIGDELAVGRALTDLARQLVRVTEEDIGTIEGHPVRLRR